MIPFVASRSPARKETAVLRNGHVQLSAAVLRDAGLKDGDALSVIVQPDGGILLGTVDAVATTDNALDARGRPVPPTWMLQAVVGNSDPEAFAVSGDESARTFVRVLEDAGFAPRNFERVLDFGCGVGRVLRSMPDVTPAALFGCDAKQEFVDWCSGNLAFAHIVANGENPPLPFPNDHFDLVYAVSVLTHLDEAHQDRWLEEWNRVLKPGGGIIATFKGGTGEQYGEDTSPEHRALVAANRGLLFMKTGYWNGVFPDFYETTYHSIDYVRAHWGRNFEVLRLYAVGALGVPQDVALMRKPERAR
jgi:SAM-dependent methyltransferase